MTKYEYESRLSLCMQVIAAGKKILATGHNPRLTCNDPVAMDRLEKELQAERARKAALYETEKGFEEYNRERFSRV